MSKWHEMKAAVQEAEHTFRAADSISKDMAELLIGRLRKVSNSYVGNDALCKLKRELRDFNMTTGEWK